MISGIFGNGFIQFGNGCICIVVIEKFRCSVMLGADAGRCENGTGKMSAEKQTDTYNQNTDDISSLHGNHHIIVVDSMHHKTSVCYPICKKTLASAHQ